MVAEQEVNDLFCGDVSVAIQAKRRHPRLGQEGLET